MSAFEPGIATDPADIQRALQLLSATGKFQILQRFQPRDVYCDDDGSDKKLVMIIDTETTGLDHEEDKIFEIGYLLAEYSPESGKVFRILDRYSGLEDPGFPLSPEIEKLTGVSYSEVQGKTFDRVKIAADAARADLVMPHNAAFDRKFLEKEFPFFKAKDWACSMASGPWKEMGISTRKLDYLVWRLLGKFYDGHRALTDAEALLDLVATAATPDGVPAFKHILNHSGEPRFVVWANGSPFELKDELKARGYRWSDGSDPEKFKAWYLEQVSDIDAELDWLGQNIYGRDAKINVDLVLPCDAYSGRYSERQQVEVIAQKKPSASPRP